jgi:hypothetical protein
MRNELSLFCSVDSVCLVIKGLIRKELEMPDAVEFLFRYILQVEKKLQLLVSCSLLS